MSDLSAEKVRELLHYDKETGIFRWRVSTNSRAQAGSVAGYANHGYIQITLSRRKYFAHRLAWLYVHGAWPQNYIDHINGNCGDNRLSNLREATHSENQHNQQKANSSNKSCGLLGVTWSAKSKKWQAKIKIGGKRRYLGLYSTAEEAHAAYLKAKAELHPFAMVAKGAAMSDLQRDIERIDGLVSAEGWPGHAEAWQRIRARLTPDRGAAEREAADIEAIRFARRAAGLLHGFMLDTNAIGAREAGVNLARSIKEALKADAAIKAMEGNDDHA